MVCTPFPCWFVIETNPLGFTPHRLYRPVLTRNSTSHNNDRIKKIMLDPVASHHAVTMAYCFDSKTRADIFFFLSSTCFLHLMTYWRVPIIAQHGHPNLAPNFSLNILDATKYFFSRIKCRHFKTWVKLLI